MSPIASFNCRTWVERYSIKHASIKDVAFANKALQKLKSSDMQLHFPTLLTNHSVYIQGMENLPKNP